MQNPRPMKLRLNRDDGLDRNRSAYYNAVVAGDAGASHRVIDEVLAKQCSLGTIYAEVIAPALVSVGDLWCRRDIGVAEEHLATQIVLSHLDRLGAFFAWRERRSSFRVLVACVEGERHFIGARMFADLCRSHGWTADFLGPDVPDDALLEMVQKRRPQLVALSATMPEGVEHACLVVTRLAALAAPPRILVGGQAFATAGSAAVLTGPATIASDARHGIELALGFLRANRPKVLLKEYLLALGRRVRELRTQKAWTQEHLAEATRVTRVCIVAVEGGKQNVSMDIVIRLANALSVTPENLLAGDGETLQALGRNG